MLLVGAGGLGSPAALYLAAAGVGMISIADSDTIEESNLQRQVIHSEAGVGQSKAVSAASVCLRLNSRVRVVPLPAVTPANVADVVRMHTIVVRGAPARPPARCAHAARIQIPPSKRQVKCECTALRSASARSSTAATTSRRATCSPTPPRPAASPWSPAPPSASKGRRAIKSSPRHVCRAPWGPIPPGSRRLLPAPPLQVMVLCGSGRAKAPCYRCLFPQAPSAGACARCVRPLHPFPSLCPPACAWAVSLKCFG